MSMEACSSAYEADEPQIRKELTLGAVSCTGTPPTPPRPNTWLTLGGGEGLGTGGYVAGPLELRQQHRGVRDSERLPEVCPSYTKDTWRALI